MAIYTRKGDDGTTGLLHGGRVPKDSAIVVALGDLDEAQAAIGMARALTTDRDLHATLTSSAPTLWSVMAFVAENPDRQHSSPDNALGERTREVEALAKRGITS